MEIVCRKLDARDIDRALEMNRSFREGLIRREAALAFLKDPKNWLFAALTGDTVIGFAYGYTLSRLDGAGDMLYIHEVGVTDAYQRRGVGYRMMTALKEECRKRGVSKYFLSAYQNNAGANALYKKLGGTVSTESGGNDVCYYFPID